MSAEHHHDDHAGHGDHATGAHEVDNMPSARLFNLMVGLSVLTLAACFGVVQLFNMQVESIRADRAKAGPYSRKAYEAEMRTILDGYGKTTVPDGESQRTLYRIPVRRATERVLNDASLLGGKARPLEAAKPAVPAPPPAG